MENNNYYNDYCKYINEFDSYNEFEKKTIYESIDLSDISFICKNIDSPSLEIKTNFRESNLKFTKHALENYVIEDLGLVKIKTTNKVNTFIIMLLNVYFHFNTFYGVTYKKDIAMLIETVLFYYKNKIKISDVINISEEFDIINKIEFSLDFIQYICSNKIKDYNIVNIRPFFKYYDKDYIYNIIFFKQKVKELSNENCIILSNDFCKDYHISIIRNFIDFKRKELLKNIAKKKCYLEFKVLIPNELDNYYIKFSLHKHINKKSDIIILKNSKDENFSILNKDIELFDKRFIIDSVDEAKFVIDGKKLNEYCTIRTEMGQIFSDGNCASMFEEEVYFKVK